MYLKNLFHLQSLRGKIMNNQQYGKASKKEIKQCVLENYTIAKRVHNRLEEDFWGYILNCIQIAERNSNEDSKKQSL